MDLQDHYIHLPPAREVQILKERPNQELMFTLCVTDLVNGMYYLLFPISHL